MSIPIFDLSTTAGKAGLAKRLAALKQTASASSTAAETVARIIADVRTRGDEAVVDYMRKWTDPQFSAKSIRVTTAELAQAEKTLDKDLRRSILTAIAHVRKYQQHIKPHDPRPITIDGAQLGLRFTPVASAGLTVPGGTAVLFSSLIMLAVPAQAAGVDPRQIAVVNPPPTRRAGEAARDNFPDCAGHLPAAGHRARLPHRRGAGGGGPGAGHCERRTGGTHRRPGQCVRATGQAATRRAGGIGQRVLWPRAKLC